jgi:hypothetical protein
MPREFLASTQKWYAVESLAVSAQQQVSRTGAAMPRLGRCRRENVRPQLRLLEPTRHRALEDTRPVRAESAPGDDEDTAAAGGARSRDKGDELPMRLGLGHSMQIELCLDRVQAAFQPLSICTIDSSEAVERQRRPALRLQLSSQRFWLWHCSRRRQTWRANTQWPYVAGGFLPQRAVTALPLRAVRIFRHLPSHDPLRPARYGDAVARAHPIRCAARYPLSATDR